MMTRWLPWLPASVRPMRPPRHYEIRLTARCYDREDGTVVLVSPELTFQPIAANDRDAIAGLFAFGMPAWCEPASAQEIARRTLEETAAAVRLRTAARRLTGFCRASLEAGLPLPGLWGMRFTRRLRELVTHVEQALEGMGDVDRAA